MNAGHEGCVSEAIDSLAVRHRHGTHGTAMEASLEGDDVRSSGSVTGQLERAFNRFRATATEEELVEPLRYDRLELLGELQHGLVVGHPHLDVGKLGHLLLGSGNDLRVAMAGIRYTDTAGEVE